jgi:protocatechuate 4,5-dioxygenase alpha chain
VIGVDREYEDIPGTFVFDGRRSREGYWLNMFCMSLSDEANREAFRADEQRYLDRFALSPEQRQAVLEREWLRMLELGGNIYYTFKLAACDGMTFQQLAAEQTGMTEDDYVGMMLAGGRPIEGNRRASEWEDVDRG